MTEKCRLEAWDDDSPREGPLTEHMLGPIEKLQYTMREADGALRNLSNTVADLRACIREQCHGYPRELHQSAATACQGVELARAELARAHAQVYALIVEMENHSG